MENCNFYNYADDNFVSRSSPDVNAIYPICHISLKWLTTMGW